jgi:hypothetical protein
LTDSLEPFIDSLSGYHLFIIAGVYEHGEWPTLSESLFSPFQPAILNFLNGGGRLYWEGAMALSDITSGGNDTLFDYFNAGPLDLITYPFSYIRGREGSFFEAIDSLGYNSGDDATDYVMSYSGIDREIIQAPEAGQNRGTNKATIYETGNTRTMLANFAWSRLHDGYANTRVELIQDVMDWLSGTVGVEEDPGQAVPAQFSLSQNFPNPFNAATTIEYALPQAAAVRLEVFDIVGQRIATLVDGPQPAGYHRATWNAGGQSSGIYFVKLRAGNRAATGKMTLVK